MDDKQISWKDNILKSSLPLEQLVSEVLEHNDLYTAGAYSYIRPNDHNIDTEFSVDVFAHQDFSSSRAQKMGRSNFLVECKYR
ncbi:hypothetical protein [Ktedonobacter racemifer]|uniref:hypothetical protein n=1 Tax=Ktedonobacter racemifer TaxID=363277 RepID=UPI0012FA6D34|nr:hypothetical protein [Ktedonobacter racemifer]